MKNGDQVRITPTKTDIPLPWKNIELTGIVLYIDTDGTVAVEVNGPHAGHIFSQNPKVGPAQNGWWFLPNELEELNGTNRADK